MMVASRYAEYFHCPKLGMIRPMTVFREFAEIVGGSPRGIDEFDGAQFCPQWISLSY